MSDPLIHTNFASFYIQERIKAGGMAIVYKAYDEQRNAVVALKILQDSLTIHDEIVQRFTQEALIGAQLKHPNIVPFYDSGEHRGRLFIAMQYLSGGSLADRIAQDARISLARSAEIIADISSALDYAHRKKVVHRDLKLGNILLDENGKSLLSDFGIARLLDTQGLTITGHQMPGTVKYMSPEQAVGLKDSLTYRSDLYSLAVIGYLLTVGMYPFTGVSDIVIINQHLNRIAPKPSLVNPLLPPALDDVLLKGLSKNIDDRYISAGAFADAFIDAIKGYGDVVTTINMRAENPGLADSTGGDFKTGFGQPDGTYSGSTMRFEDVGSGPIPTGPRTLNGNNSNRLWFFGGLGLLLIASLFFVFNGRGSGGQVNLDETATQLAVVAMGETNTPSITPTDTATSTDTATPTDTATSTDTATPTDTATSTDTTTPTDTATSTDTPTYTPTDTPTSTDTPTYTPTPTVTHTFTPSVTPRQSPTATATHTPTATRTPSATPTATPLFLTLEEAIDAFIAFSSPNEFNCVLYIRSFESLERHINSGSLEFAAATTLMDADDDPLRVVYEDECLENSDNESHIIPFDLFRDMQDALSEFNDNNN